MSDDQSPNRKKLSLKIKRDKPQSIFKNSNQNEVLSNSFIESNKDLSSILAEREILDKKINQINNRLIFGYSQPLQSQCTTMKKDDLALACKMTDILVNNL
ncbi:MAG: hypothetical protein ACJA0H_000406 [Francisellaceae bacterium]|jgi:hypothetical protein